MVQEGNISAEDAIRHAEALNSVRVRKKGDAQRILLMNMVKEGNLSIEEAMRHAKGEYGRGGIGCCSALSKGRDRGAQGLSVLRVFTVLFHVSRWSPTSPSGMGVEVGTRDNENVGGLASQAGKIYNFGTHRRSKTRTQSGRGRIRLTPHPNNRRLQVQQAQGRTAAHSPARLPDRGHVQCAARPPQQPVSL